MITADSSLLPMPMHGSHVCVSKESETVVPDSNSFTTGVSKNIFLEHEIFVYSIVMEYIVHFIVHVP